MTDTTLFKAPCPVCGRQCNTFVHGEKLVEWNDDYEGANLFGGTLHKLLECCGCGIVFYYTETWFSEDWDYGAQGEMVLNHKIKTVPAASIRPKWVDQISLKDSTLSNILQQVYTAVENDTLILAAIGLRTAFDRTTEIRGIEPGLPMCMKVQAVFKAGYVGDTERDQLNIVTDAGNAAAHRGWHPDRGDFKPLLNVMENFIQKALLRDKRIEEIGERIPKRRKKQG